MPNGNNNDNKPKTNVISVTIACKCGNELTIPIPMRELLFNINIAQLILIPSFPPETRACGKCGLIYAPRFKMEAPPEFVMGMVEWVAFKPKGSSVAVPTPQDVKNFGK